MKHSVVSTNGIRIHCVEEGEGPLVLLVHGFPESWYSWRHQLPALAAAGYRAVAIDVRGYGRSSRPVEVEAYRMVKLAGDVVALVEALGASRAALIGHDWGAPIVWTSALLRPDLFWGVAGLSVPYNPRGATRPLEAMRKMAGDDEFSSEPRQGSAPHRSLSNPPSAGPTEFYVEYFQQPGRAEAEIEKDVRRWLLGFYWSASGDAPRDVPSLALVPRGAEVRDRFTYPESPPPWLTDADLDFYTGEFERTGFSGGLNRYRNVDRDWEDLAAFHGAPIQVPALFVGGDRDGPTIWGKPAIDAFPRTLPRLWRAEILPGCGHWIQQERPAETNRLLVDFLAAVRV
jgi:pimeloyl-ACP methyl ester carboxylesterase